MAGVEVGAEGGAFELMFAVVALLFSSPPDEHDVAKAVSEPASAMVSSFFIRSFFLVS
jgi:hypothetical protein